MDKFYFMFTLAAWPMTISSKNEITLGQYTNEFVMLVSCSLFVQMSKWFPKWIQS